MSQRLSASPFFNTCIECCCCWFFCFCCKFVCLVRFFWGGGVITCKWMEFRFRRLWHKIYSTVYLPSALCPPRWPSVSLRRSRPLYSKRPVCMRKLQIKQLYTQRELSECTIHLMNLQGEKTKKKYAIVYKLSLKKID